MVVFLCDLCGMKVAQEERGAVVITLPAAEKARPAEPRWPSEAKRREPQPASFDLCGECGLGLLVSLKAQKLRARRGGEVQ